MGAAGIERLLKEMPGAKNISSFVGGGFDFTYMVFDRVNGALAGLDLGVMNAMKRASLGNDEWVNDREMRPGLDDWPADAFALLAPGAATQAGSGGPDVGRVDRLEKRVDAAQQAYTRLRSARDAGTAPAQFDSVDWSLVNTGIQHAAPSVADIGQLGATMVRQQAVTPTEMSYVAPAVKAVAQQAQLSERGESAPAASEAPSAADVGGGAEEATKKVNYNDLAMKIATRLQRRFARDRDRQGRT
jgi:hypothetical protein